MTQEDKELLLCDLSARLPYGLKCKCPILSHETYTIVSIELNDGCHMVGLNTTRNSYIYAPLEEVKPYLRPMSSMTEEEKEDFEMRFRFSPIESLYILGYGYVYSVSVIDWLNAHHFDYRGIIEKGLAIEVTKDNNPYEN